ncbi:MAG: M50 family metallopeptidase [Verrucomicrobiota bacterium]
MHLHWSWFVIAAYQFLQRQHLYADPLWSVAEYVSLFGIVLMHEFGHALACRQTGGHANQIVLWPFGGVAYVAPPERPGAQLWSIAAGPLVNVVLMPVFVGLYWYAVQSGWDQSRADLHGFLESLVWINGILLIFNLLPVYPLDGGQILRSLLWFACGRGRSLQIAAIVGLIGGAGFVAYAVWQGSIWMILITLFLLANCWQGLKRSRELIEIDRLRV